MSLRMPPQKSMPPHTTVSRAQSWLQRLPHAEVWNKSIVHQAAPHLPADESPDYLIDVRAANRVKSYPRLMNRRLTGTRYTLAAPLSNDGNSHPIVFQQKPRQSAFESAFARINEGMGQIPSAVPPVVPAQRPVKRTHLGAPFANGGWDPCGTRKTPFRWFLPAEGG